MHCHAQLCMWVLGSKQVLTANKANIFQLHYPPLWPWTWPMLRTCFSACPFKSPGFTTKQSAMLTSQVPMPFSQSDCQVELPGPPAAFSVTLPTPGFHMLLSVLIPHKFTTLIQTPVITPLVTLTCPSMVLYLSLH